MSINEKLSAICQTFCDGKKSIMATKMNVSDQVVRNWFLRNTMDYVKVAQAFPQVNAEWLLRDNGPMTGRACQELEPSTKAIAEKDPKHNTSLVYALISQLKEKDNQINNLISILKEMNLPS